MFKRKRVSRRPPAPLESNTSGASRQLAGDSLEFFQIQSQKKVDNAYERELPELLSKLNADVSCCETILKTMTGNSNDCYKINEGKVNASKQKGQWPYIPSQQAPSSTFELNSILLLHRTLSGWSVCPVFLRSISSDTTRKGRNIQDVLLGMRVLGILETTKSLIFLRTTRLVHQK